MRNSVFNYLSKNQVLVALIFLAFVWIIIQIREVLVALFVSYILMAAITPYVEYLRKKRVPKPIAVIIPYVVAIAGVLLIIITLLPFFVGQISLLLSRLPYYLNQDFTIMGTRIDSQQISSVAASELSNIGGNAVAITSKLFGGVVSVISIFAISFYLLLYRGKFVDGLTSLFPKSYQEKASATLDQVEDKLGAWLRGQLVLSGFIGILTWVILTLLGVDYALPLAVIAGLLEIVPTIGPIISAIPAIIVALNVSPFLAIIVGISYFFIQLLENNILVPRIMQRAVGLNPIVIILGIIIGGKLLGIAGALLAIPFISLLIVAYKNLE